MINKKENPIFKNSFKGLGTDISLILVLENESDRKKADEDFGELVSFYGKQEKIFRKDVHAKSEKLAQTGI